MWKNKGLRTACKIQKNKAWEVDFASCRTENKETDPQEKKKQMIFD